MRRLAVLFAVPLIAGCASGAVGLARARLAAEDLAGAVEAAGTDPRALEAVSFDVLERAMAEERDRPAAARGLAAAGRRAAPSLERLARSDDSALSAVAMAGLARLGVRSAEERLEPRLEDASGEARAAAAGALGPLRRDRAFFERFLGDIDDRVRRAAVGALGSPGHERLAAALLEEVARRDPDPGVRAAAFGAMARRAPGEGLVEAARSGLGDRVLAVRLAAIEALVRAEDRAVASALLARPLASEDPAESIRAACALTRLGDATGLERLERALVAPSVVEASAGAIAASQLGTALAGPLAEALGRREPEVRLHVATALLRLGPDGRALEVLAALLDAPRTIGLRAAVVLVSHRPGEGLDRLVRATGHESASVRAYAAGSAAEVPGGLEVARRLLADDTPAVRISAATALLRILGRPDREAGPRGSR